MSAGRGVAVTAHDAASNLRALQIFVACAFLISWSCWIPLIAVGAVVEPGKGLPTHFLGLLGPAGAAIIATGVVDGWTGLAQLWSRAVHWRVAWPLYALVLATGALIVIPVISPGIASASDLVDLSGAPRLGVLTFFYVLLINGFGEELGWRGFLADRLLERWTPLRTSIAVWVVWGLWHLPLFWIIGNFRDLTPAGIAGWTVGLLFGSIFLTWLYRTAQRSVLVVALWHTVYNFTTATTAAAGTAAAISSTFVIVLASIVSLVPAVRRRSTVADINPLGP